MALFGHSPAQIPHRRHSSARQSALRSAASMPMALNGHERTQVRHRTHLSPSTTTWAVSTTAVRGARSACASSAAARASRSTAGSHVSPRQAPTANTPCRLVSRGEESAGVVLEPGQGVEIEPEHLGELRVRGRAEAPRADRDEVAGELHVGTGDRVARGDRDRALAGTPDPHHGGARVLQNRHARLAGVVVGLVEGKARDLRVAHEQRDRGPVRTQRLDRDAVGGVAGCLALVDLEVEQYGQRLRQLTQAQSGEVRGQARERDDLPRHERPFRGIGQLEPGRDHHRAEGALLDAGGSPQPGRERAREPVESRQGRGRQHVDTGLPLADHGRPVDHRHRVAEPCQRPGRFEPRGAGADHQHVLPELPSAGFEDGHRLERRHGPTDARRGGCRIRPLIQ